LFLIVFDINDGRGIYKIGLQMTKKQALKSANQPLETTLKNGIRFIIFYPIITLLITFSLITYHLSKFLAN